LTHGARSLTRPHGDRPGGRVERDRMREARAVRSTVHLASDLET